MLRRTAQQHETLRAQSGVQDESYTDFKISERVMTADGFPGRVEAVHGGPYPGSEAYEVTLDGGMGGGLYSAGQLKKMADEEYTASADYPELAEVLVERPDPGKQVILARKTAVSQAEKAEWAEQTKDALDVSARARGHKMQWKGIDLKSKGQAPHYVGECQNCGHTAVAGDSWSSTHSHATCDARHSTCDGPDSKWKTDMVNELMHKRMQQAVSDFGQNVKNEQDKAWLHDQGLEAKKTASTLPDDHPDKVWLRFGAWPEDERSMNHAMGWKEDGVSVYDLNHHGDPVNPDANMGRWHEHDESCGPDCEQDQFNDDYSNDTGEEMRGRAYRAEKARRSGAYDHPDDGHLVKGTMVGIGHDGEPLLHNVRRVGDWIDHRHLFIPTAQPHHLSRHPDDEDYEPPEELPHKHATTINDVKIDGHGDAPDEVRADDPNSYDKRSTEGQPDPKQNEPLNKEMADAYRGAELMKGMVGASFGQLLVRADWNDPEHGLSHNRPWDNGGHEDHSTGWMDPERGTIYDQHLVEPEVEEPHGVACYIHHDGPCPTFGGTTASLHTAMPSKRHPEPEGFSHSIDTHSHGYDGGGGHTLHGFINGHHVGSIDFSTYGGTGADAEALKVHMLHGNENYGQYHGVRGVASTMMDRLYKEHPKAWINHGYRTDQGLRWWNSYDEPDPHRNVHNVHPSEGWDQHFDTDDVANDMWHNYHNDDSGDHHAPDWSSDPHESDYHDYYCEDCDKHHDDPDHESEYHEPEEKDEPEDDEDKHDPDPRNTSLSHGTSIYLHPVDHAIVHNPHLPTEVRANHLMHAIGHGNLPRGEWRNAFGPATQDAVRHAATHSENGGGTHPHTEVTFHISPVHHDEIFDGYDKPHFTTRPQEGVVDFHSPHGDADPIQTSLKGVAWAEHGKSHRATYHDFSREEGGTGRTVGLKPDVEHVREERNRPEESVMTSTQYPGYGDAGAGGEREHPEWYQDLLDHEKKNRPNHPVAPGFGEQKKLFASRNDDGLDDVLFPGGNAFDRWEEKTANVVMPEPQRNPLTGREDENELAKHLVNEHGFSHDQLANLPDPGQNDPLSAAHYLEHSADADDGVGGAGWGAGENESTMFAHKHNDAPWDEGDEGWLRNNGFQASKRLNDPYELVAQAATDSELRFHFTAAWADVRAKAKRIRTEGKVRVTLATDGMIIGEVQGDHHTYETGIQRLPGQRLSVSGWSCGCKWGAYHWGAEDDFSRFAGRMCSHALALQFEAQSRGMFGNVVEIDKTKPDWVPPRVVVKHDIDSGQNRLVRSSAREAHVLETPADTFQSWAFLQGEDQESITLLLRTAGLIQAAVEGWQSPEEEAKDRFDATDLLGQHGIHVRPGGPLAEGIEDVADLEHTIQIHPDQVLYTEQGDLNQKVLDHYRRNGPGVVHPPTTQRDHDEADMPHYPTVVTHGGHHWLTDGHHRVVVHRERNEPFTAWHVDPERDRREYEEWARRHQAAVNDPWGEPTADTVAKPYGATSPPNPYQSPASAGFLTAPDPDSWSNLGNGGMYSYSALHDEPEGALPSTDGDLEDTDMEPENPSIMTMGQAMEVSRQIMLKAERERTELAEREANQIGGDDEVMDEAEPDPNDVVAQFQASAAAKSLMEGGGGSGAGYSDADIAKAAKLALKQFTPAEQQALINEGVGVRASNFDRLDIAGTHYAELDDEEDPTWMI